MTVGIAACSLAGLAQACAAVKDLGASGSVADAGNDARADAADAAADVATDGFGGDAATYEPTALFIHASPSLPDVRLCWSIDGVTAATAPFPGSGAMPGSNYPGIPKGGAASLADAHGLAGGTLTLYAVDAESLARNGESEVACADLICPAASSCLRKNLDYWALASIDGSAFSSGANVVVAVSGCWASVLDPAATAERCGASWDPVEGNLHAELLALQPAMDVDGGALAVQVALFSPSLAAAMGDAGVAVAFGPADGGVLVATLDQEDELQPASPVALPLGASLAVYGATGFAVDAPALADAGGQAWLSLAQAQALLDPTQDPSAFFGQTRTYLVAVVGDPGAAHAFVTTADGGYDGTGLHVLVVASPAPVAISARDD